MDIENDLGGKLVETLFRFMSFISISISMLGASCAPPQAHSFENHSDQLLSPTPENFNGDAINRVIKELGWQVPSKNNTAIGERAIETIESSDGKDFKVRTTYYTPKDKVVFEGTAPYGIKTRVQGKLELIHFQEFDLKGKIYLYALTVQKYLDGGQANDNASHEELFVYQIIDDDGDGKFETLLEKRSNVTIPTWATK